MEVQALLWDVPPTYRGSGWYLKDIPVIGVGWSQGQHRSTVPEHKIDKELGLPDLTGPNVKIVQRCPWTGHAQNSTVHNPGRYKARCRHIAKIHYSQTARILYRNICTMYGLEISGSKKVQRTTVIDKGWAKILWDFQIQTNKMVMANLAYIMVVDKQEKKASLLWCQMLQCQVTIGKKELEALVHILYI